MGPASRPMWPGQLELWIFFFFFFFFFPPEALSVPVTGGPVRLRPRESYGRGFLSLTCRSYQFSRLSGRPVVPLRSGSFRYGVIFGPPPQV